MSSHKRKKVTKYRGSKTHGGGSMKKRRGAGSRGGRGRAGSGKRGDVKKPSYWKDWKMGKHGFINPTSEPNTFVNVGDLHKRVAELLEAGSASEKGGVVTIDLSKVGVDKLLGTGRVSQKFNLTVEQASNKAVEKIEAAGGSVTVLSDGNAQSSDDSEEDAEE